MVDTAAFTASTLRMSDADALGVTRVDPQRDLMTYLAAETFNAELVAWLLAHGAEVNARNPDNARHERKSIAAIAKWIDLGAPYDRPLVENPRDIFTIQTAHLFDFFRGDALNLRNRITRVLPHWTDGVPGYSYVLGMHAFGLEECHAYAEAEETALAVGVSALTNAPQMLSTVGIRGRGAFSSSWRQKPYSVEAIDETGDEREVAPLDLPALAASYAASNSAAASPNRPWR